MLEPGAIPRPESEFDQERWSHSSLRRRMLSGLWEQDLKDSISNHVQSQRAQAWGVPDLSSNVFCSVVTQLAALYDVRPTVTNASDAAALIEPGGLIDAAGLFPLMPRFESNTLGMREMMMRVSYDKKATGLHYRPVTPDRFVAWSRAAAPSIMTGFKELRLRTDPDTKEDVWAWDLVDVTDPEKPVYQVLEVNEQGETSDQTAKYLGSDLSGPNYPIRDAAGTPRLDGVLYHAEAIGDGLWDAWKGCEVVYGSLKASVLWTFFGHAVLDASWPQRWAANAKVSGVEVTDAGQAGRRQQIPADPAMIIIFELLEENGGQAMIGQWEPAANIDDLFAAIGQYESRLSEFANVSPADIQRVSGEARSGYAIAITNEGKRTAQRRFEPQFRRGDLEVIELSAILVNRATGSAFPESGYGVAYESVPLSAAERKAVLEAITLKVDMGLMSKIDAFMELHPGVNREEAIKRLRQIRQDEAEI